ncbi:MAG: EamA family transporter [Arenicella sp.]
MNSKDFLLGIAVTFVWGINFSVIKLGLSSLDPFTLAGLRFSLCALPLVFIIPKPDVSMSYIVSYGLFFGVGLWGLTSLGIYWGISAGVASLVLQTSVFLTILMGYLFLHETIDTIKMTGFIFALAGLVCIIQLTDGSVTFYGMVLVLVAALCWSVANIIVKKSGTTRIFSFIIWSSLFSPIPLFFLAYATQGSIVFINFFENLDKTAIFSILFQVYPTTLLGYWVWNSLLKKYPTTSVAPLSLLVPIFGLLGSHIIFNEVIGTGKILACLLIISGLLVSLFGQSLWLKFKHEVAS